MKIFFVCTLLILSFDSCGIGCRAGEFTRIPIEFLNKLRLKLPEEAKEYCTPKACDFIDSCLKNSIIIDVSEVKDVKCFVNGDTITCTFCCLNDTLNSEFKMVKANKVRKGYIDWLVDDLSPIFSKE